MVMSLNLFSHPELSGRGSYPGGVGYLLGANWRFIPSMDLGFSYQNAYHYEKIRFFKKDNELESDFQIMNLHVKWYMTPGFYLKGGLAQITLDQKVDKIYDDNYEKDLDNKYNFKRNTKTTGLVYGFGGHVNSKATSTYFWELVFTTFSFQKSQDMSLVLGYKFFIGAGGGEGGGGEDN